KRYPNGAEGDYFYMKRAPEPRPDWIEICAIPHSEGLVSYPMVQDLPSLMWLINLGCIDLNPWYARCDDWDRPDFLHFDLDPGPGANFDRVREVALRVRDILAALKMPTYPKTTGSKGIHVYIPIVRGPLQKEVWTFAKAIAIQLEQMHPEIITAEYRKVKRPYGRVLVDYNQNAWGRTLASIYSIRPTPVASVSTPVTWDEVEEGVRIQDFRIDNVVERVSELGDLWKPVIAAKKRFDLRKVLEAKSVDKVPAGDGWQFEPKWDGFRAVIFRDGDDVYVQSKSGQPLARYFPDVVEAIRSVKTKQFVLDGEIVVPVNGRLSFD